VGYEIEKAKCVAKTASAILVEAPEFDKPEWIPQSQVDEDSEVYGQGHTGTLVVSDWLAEQRGWT